MGYTRLSAADAFWRPSNQMKVENTDLAGQLEASRLGMRLWRLAPGQASTWHRHRDEEEIYVLLEGTGRIRIEGSESLTLSPMDSLLIEPTTLRQIFNDTDSDALWLVAGAPPDFPKGANTLTMDEETLAYMYPDGPKALPPELGGGEFAG
jgi:quercetin dioxygenase-like cupin family protein